MAVLASGSAEEGPPKEGITDATIEEGLPAEQLIAPRFISPHPLVSFTEVPAICGEQSNHVVIDNVVDTEAQILLEAVSPPLESSRVEAESPVTEESLSTPSQTASMSQKAPEVEAGSSSAGKRFESPTQTSRPETAVGFDFESRKRRTRHGLPTFSASHSRNVSSSSNNTLVWSPAGPSSASSPISPKFGQMLQDAYQQIIGDNPIDRVQELEQVNADLTQRLATQTERAKGLKTDLENCERSRELNFNIALRLYRDSGNMVLLERRNLFEQIEQLKSEIWNRDWHISSRDQFIEALRLDLHLYASQGHWLRMQEVFRNLHHQYGRMPQDLRTLEQQYQDLEDRHIDACNMFKKLDGDHTELKVQLDQVKDERNRLEDDAAEAAADNWALRAQRDRIVDQKAESERTARANEQFLAGLAGRMFKQLICMADILEDMGVNPMDNEQIALCQLAYNYLGLDATQISNELDKAGASGDREIEDEHDENDVLDNNAGEGSSSMSTSEYYQEPTIPIAGFNNSSNIAPTAGKEVLESPDTFDARRRREVAAAEERILGPLGLGFDDGSPTLKSKPIPESSKSTKVSKFMSLFPKSPESPSKTGGSPSRSGANEIDQVTPARTGGTGGIARDQWATAGSDLREFTEVFRGPRSQPIDIVSPDSGTNGKENGSHLKEENPFQDSEGPILSPNELMVHENGVTEESGSGRGLDVGEDGVVLEGENGETGGSEDGADSETNISNQIATSSSAPTNGKGKSSDTWEDVSFGIDKQEQTFSEFQNPFTTSPAAAIESESSSGSATSASSPETPPLGESSPIFQDARVGNDATNEEASDIPSVPKEVFNAPKFQNFDFVGSSSGIPFTGSQTNSSATAGPTSEPTPTTLFNLPHASPPEGPTTTTHDPPRFEQNFNFSGSNSQISFTASQALTSSRPPAPPAPPMLESAGHASSSSSPLRTSSSAQRYIPRFETTALREVTSDGHASSSNTPGNNNNNNNNGIKGKNTKGKNNKGESRMSAPVPNPGGPNRSQRRAASRERKAAEKKAQAAARDAARGGRMAVARELMGG